MDGALIMIDPQHFRSVLGTYPTGVCVVTACDDGGDRHALVVGSFTSISLDPPLVGFFPAKTSTTWPKIAATGSFCVNVVGADQLAICQAMASSSVDRFDGIALDVDLCRHGVIQGAQSWFECSVERVVEIGDHFLVVGAVEQLAGTDAGDALVFHRKGYRSTAATLPAG